ncbi:methyltransferase domain-containing protein [Paractinoplanes rishiriensis]|uniref:Methyltransferase type 12 n=1 Tax=Paractinoplanes rishiriensis TaxID=1050105 RepID=A0A919K8X3_9ACTN|nr:class I SAM-dependent methyltransferase [Actinoplanes rishiriensis]GIF02194.1 methyltransferase type 12 [Actinoplanes rishiriensis]
MSAVFDAALRRVEAGRPAAFTVRGLTFDPALWCRDDLPGDAALLDPCTGPTLDVGCGPGRLSAALARAGRPALGIDISAAAVRLARRRGATALRRDVFTALPGTGRWRHLLLADENIGIGGDPLRLLHRCRELLAPAGRLHAEFAPPGTPSWSGPATAHTPTGVTALAWASVAFDDLGELAATAGMRVLNTRTQAGRWFATLSPR